MWQRLFNRRFKKRYVWVFLACLLAVTLPALALVSFVTGPASGDRVFEIALAGEASRQAVVGNGINLASLGADNLLIHGGFEPLVYRKDLLAAGGDASTILIASGDQSASQGAEIPLDSFFDGANFRVMSNRGGQLRVKHTGQVISCLPEQITAFHSYDLPLEPSPQLSWQDCLEQEGKLFLAGSQGYILAQLRGDPQLFQSESQQDFVQLAAGPQGPLALDRAGSIYLLTPEGLEELYRPAGPQTQVEILNPSAAGIYSLYNKAPDQGGVAGTSHCPRVHPSLVTKTSEAGFKSLVSLPVTEEDQDLYLVLALDGQGQVYLAKLPAAYPAPAQESANSPNIPNLQLDFQALELPQGPRTEHIFQDQGYVYLLTATPALYRSNNGQDWSELLTPNSPEREELYPQDWLCLSSWQDKLFLAGREGQALFWDPLAAIKLTFDPRQIVPAGPLPDFVDCLIISDQHLLLVDDQGQLYESVDAGESWQVRKSGVTGIYLSTDANLILSQDQGLLSSAILGVQIITDPPLEEGNYLAGDLVRLEQQSPLPWARIRQHELEARSSQEPKLSPQETVPGDWYRSPNAEVQPVLDQVPPLGGQASLAISPSPEAASSAASDSGLELDTADLSAGNPLKRQLVGIYSGSFLPDTGKFKAQDLRISQPLTAESLGLMQGNSAFELSFWAKADSPEAYVEVDLTGPNMPSDPVRRYLTTDWSQYSVLFIIPWSVAENSDLRLNFDFAQADNFYLDSVRLVKADRNTPYQEDLQRLAELQPTILRLSYLPLSQSGLPSEYYFAQEGQYLFTDEAGLVPVYAGTLRQALQVTEEAHASPWLCISSSIEESELRHLMQYLFGSRQSDYGLRRLQDGSISRWNEVFDTIYLEFTEDELSSYNSDRERSAFVDWAIELISSTPEYGLVSHQLVFVDGMNYQEGSLLSSADAHSADYGQVVPVYNREELSSVSEGRLTSFLRDPLRLGASRPDLYRSLARGESQRLADYLAQTLQGLGRDAIMALPNMSRDASGLPPEILTALTQASQGLAGHTPYEVKITGYEEDEPQSLVVLAFADRKETRVFVLNLGQEVELFRLRDAVPERSEIWEYDWDGKLLAQQTTGWRQKTYNILPGAVLVMSTPAQP